MKNEAPSQAFARLRLLVSETVGVGLVWYSAPRPRSARESQQLAASEDKKIDKKYCRLAQYWEWEFTRAETHQAFEKYSC